MLWQKVHEIRHDRCYLRRLFQVGEGEIAAIVVPPTAMCVLISDQARLIAKQTAESNPTLFIEEQCRLSIGHEAEMGRLLETVPPDDLKTIEAWR